MGGGENFYAHNNIKKCQYIFDLMEMIDNHVGEKEEILMFVYVSILSSSTEETSVGQKAHVP